MQCSPEPRPSPGPPPAGRPGSRWHVSGASGTSPGSPAHRPPAARAGRRRSAGPHVGHAGARTRSAEWASNPLAGQLEQAARGGRRGQRRRVVNLVRGPAGGPSARWRSCRSPDPAADEARGTAFVIDGPHLEHPARADGRRRPGDSGRYRRVRSRVGRGRRCRAAAARAASTARRPAGVAASSRSSTEPCESAVAAVSPLRPACPLMKPGPNSKSHM